jgi:protein CpxP
MNMDSMVSKKFFTILVILLLLANFATIAVFWLKKEENPKPIKGGPAQFIIKELGLTKAQEEQFLALATAHQDAVRPIREGLKAAKDNFFSLLDQPNLSDSTKLAAAKNISKYSEQIDLITLNHFAQVRAMCTADQKTKFDSIIKQVTQMMAMPHPDRRPHDRPPIDDPNGMPPPSDGADDLPPPPQH